jgi:uncharacterized protein with GYD domain
VEQRDALKCRKWWKVWVGRLDAFYFVFGENDVHIILDLPENLTAAAISLAVMSIGAARMKTTVLLTPEEIDQAVKTRVDYHPPV